MFQFRTRATSVPDDNLVTMWYEEAGIDDVGADPDTYDETATEKPFEQLNAQKLTVGQKEPA